MRSNSIIYNPRVRKISKSLNKKYSVIILGWNREGLSIETIKGFFLDLKLFGLRAPFGKRTLLLRLPLFWVWILVRLIQYKPRVVHACDLDVVLPCYIYKVIFRRKLIFDVCDRYAMAYVSPKNKTLYSFVNSIEEFFSERSDVLVNVSERLLGTFRRKPIKCAVIMNCAEDSSIVKEYTASTASTVLRIFHSGGIRRTRGLEQTVRALKDLDGVELCIVGRVVDELLKKEILSNPNVKYNGLLCPEEVLRLEAKCDISMAFYDLEDPINKYSMGNKIFEAMMLGLPIITNVASEIIDEARSGFVLDYNDIIQLRKTILMLRDNPKLRKQLGQNGRSAFLQKYNWLKMEKELFNFYDDLLCE